MKRLEIITNQAIEEDIIEILINAGYGQNFSYIHPVYGRGGNGRREGSAVWPESNVMFIVYLFKGNLDGIFDELKKLKAKFPREGLKAWAFECDVESI